jgi:metal-sulfur cluster biosynthetic enzyme
MTQEQTQSEASEATPADGAATAESEPVFEVPPTEDNLWTALRDVEDPELRLSIVELGLIYGIDFDDDGVATVNMTLTSPACPVGPMLQGMIFHRLSGMEGVEDVEVNLVWDPPWDPKEMASEEVKMTLGIW